MGNWVSENLHFQNFPGEHAPGPPRKVRLRRTITFSITYEYPLENLSYAPDLYQHPGCPSLKKKSTRYLQRKDHKLLVHENFMKYTESDYTCFL